MENKTLEQVLKDIGLAARWEAEAEARGKEIGEARGKEIGEARKAKEFAQKLIQKGWALVEVAETTGLDLPTVESLMEATHA